MTSVTETKKAGEIRLRRDDPEGRVRGQEVTWGTAGSGAQGAPRTKRRESPRGRRNAPVGMSQVGHALRARRPVGNVSLELRAAGGDRERVQ